MSLRCRHQYPRIGVELGVAQGVNLAYLSDSVWAFWG